MPEARNVRHTGADKAADPTPPAPSVDEEYDGQGNRMHAVRDGLADPSLVANGLSTSPTLAGLVKTEENTDRFIAETTFGKPKGREEEDHVTFHVGGVVEGLTKEELAPLLRSGAVRRETKDEAKK